MVYIIIGFVLVLIIAPIISIMPSAKQKAQMVKRQAAMARNIRVDLTRIDDPDPDPEKYLSNTGRPLERKCAVAAYRIPRQRSRDWRQAPSTDWAVDRVEGDSSLVSALGWRWNGPPGDKVARTLNEFIVTNLNGLPEDVVRVEERNFVVSVFWKEIGEVQDTIDFLTGCIAISIFPEGPNDPVDGHPRKKLD
jgi:hypothetical protein